MGAMLNGVSFNEQSIEQKFSEEAIGAYVFSKSDGQSKFDKIKETNSGKEMVIPALVGPISEEDVGAKYQC
eukprot:10511855-Alexandrium_andersonii.AAC.1